VTLRFGFEFTVSFNQLGADTGRYSSSSVIQTLPKSDDYQIRRGFIATSGSKILAADFKQQELRILADVSGDENMRQAIAEGVDLHGLAAVGVFNLHCGADEVASQYPEKRNQVKAIQFGLIYGKSPASLAKDLGIERSEADDLLKTYFTQFPDVKKLIDETHQCVVRDGFVDDVFGRRRYLPDATLNRPKKRYDQMTDDEKAIVRRFNAARRAAQNFVIQAAGATITKLAMLRCHAAVRDRYPQVKMILTLHDELQFEVPDEQVELFAAELPELMCNLGLERFGLTVPLAVDVKVGPSWGELSPWEGAADAAA
jgi:DNA polymerase-1